MQTDAACSAIICGRREGLFPSSELSKCPTSALQDYIQISVMLQYNRSYLCFMDISFLNNLRSKYKNNRESEHKQVPPDFKGYR